MSYHVKHLNTGEPFQRDSILLNPHHQQSDNDQHPSIPSRPSQAETFHNTLPHAGETQLHPLPSVASELGFRHVFLKDESTRLGLPSFKILGASWGIFQSIRQHLQVPQAETLEDLKQALQGRKDNVHVRLVTCTEGNWGRACSRMAKYLHVPITVYVPGFMNEYTRGLIRGEGADVRVLEGGSYDDSIAAARQDAETSGALLVMDTSWEGYEEVPGWVTEGYSTMLHETDRQIRAHLSDSPNTNTLPPTLALASVGVGSWAHAVVSHYKNNTHNRIITVEPTAAPSFKESLHQDTITPIATGETIMNGMNCGTTSTLAWPVLRAGTWMAVTVDDGETHRAVRYLQERGVNAGPCGAAPLAALRKVVASGRIDEKERRGMVVVLFSTEGGREYDVPE